MQIVKNKWSWIIAAAIIIAGAAFGVFSLLARQNPPVTNYSECLSRGYKAMDTFPRSCETPDGEIFTQDIGNIPEKMDLINLESPGPNQTVNISPIPLKGQARGNWFFEGSFPVEIRDENGNIISSGIAKAEGEWMTEEFVPFTASLTVKTGFNGNAQLILRKDNPSGIPELDDELHIPLRINIVDEMTTVNVYFGLETATSGTDPCDIVYPVIHSIPRVSGIARSAIEELLKGPTEEEIAEGYFTSLPEGVRLNRISIGDGEAQVDFSSNLEEQVGGSCRVTAIRAQITETLKQFPSVNRVIISINERTEDILQP